jgi:ABC-type transporter Mla subunit MlaD
MSRFHLPTDLFKRIDETMANVDAVLGRVDPTLGDVSTTLASAEGTLGDAGDALARVDGTLGDATAVLTEVKTLLSDLRDKLDLLDQVPGMAEKLDEIHAALARAPR